MPKKITYVPVAERRRRQAEKAARAQSEDIQVVESTEAEAPIYADGPPKRVWVKEAPPRGGKTDFATAKDPTLHTRLVRDNPKRINRHKRLGYEIAHAGELSDHDGRVAPDKTVHHGDRVVMITKKDWLAEREAERQSEMRSMVDRNDDALRAEHAREAGEDIEFYKSSDHGQRKGSGKFYSIG